MATRCLTRSLFLTTRQTLASTVSRSYTAVSSAAPPSSSYLLRLRPLFAAASGSYFRRLTPAFATRGLSTRSTSSSLNDPNPNWTNRPPKETILLDGCDFEHWLIVMEKPEGDPTRDEIIDSYIDTLAMVVGSVEEARMKIYSVSTRHYYAFGALVSEEVSYKMKELPRVRWVLPDSFLDVRNKDYGGEPFINGQAMPYDPKYHEEWVRNNARANDRNRRNDRPRNFDRSRNFDRRRDFQNSGGPPGRPMGGPANTGAPPNMGGPVNTGAPPNMGGMQQQQPNMGGMQQQQPNMAGPQPNYTGGAPPNMGGMQQQPNMGGPQPNYTGGAPQQQPNMGPPPNNTGGYPPTNMAPPHNNAANYPGAPYQSGPGPSQGGGYGPNMGPAPRHNQGGGYGPNIGPAPGHNQGGGYGPNMGPAPVHNQGGYAPNMGPAPGQNQNYSPNFSGGNPNQNQNIPGRDMPPRSNQS